MHRYREQTDGCQKQGWEMEKMDKGGQNIIRKKQKNKNKSKACFNFSVF